MILKCFTNYFYLYFKQNIVCFALIKFNLQAFLLIPKSKNIGYPCHNLIKIKRHRNKLTTKITKMATELKQKAGVSEQAKLKLHEANQIFDAGDYIQAIEQYKEIIRENSQYISALNKLAESYIKVNADEKAAMVFKRIIELKPNKDATYRRLAKLMIEQGKDLEASQQYKKAISINPEQPDFVFIALGKALNRIRRENMEKENQM